VELVIRQAHLQAKVTMVEMGQILVPLVVAVLEQ
jgi:hypothetical protein